MGIHQHGKSISIKDLLVKIARREQLEITEGDATPFSMYATAWLERKKATLARSTYGDYRSIWRKYVLPYFGDMPLCRVTRLDVEAFLDRLGRVAPTHDVPDAAHLRVAHAWARRGSALGGAHAGTHQPGHDLQTLRKVHPESFPEGRWKVSGGTQGGGGLPVMRTKPMEIFLRWTIQVIACIIHP